MINLPQGDLGRRGGAPEHDRHGRRLGPVVHRHHLFHKDVDLVLLEVREKRELYVRGRGTMYDVIVCLITLLCTTRLA